MLYDYQCEHCGHLIIDHYQSIHSDPITLCPQCHTDNLSRIITGGMGCFIKDVKTIGQLADSNYAKLGKYRQSEIAEKTAQKKTKSFFDNAGPASKQQINKMSPEQKKKYIITGET
jgi:putative FmdB family regulatory protein